MERLRLFLPVSNRRSGRWRDRRQLIDGILHRLRTGVQRRDLPKRFGQWKTVDERHRLWSADGTRRRPLQQVQAGADGADGVDCDVSVDPRSCVPTSTRSAPAPTCRRRWPQRGLGEGAPVRDAVAEPRRPPGGGGSGGEGLGRSRGGFTTKVHLSADGRCRRPLSLVVTLGRRADRTQVDPCWRRSVFPGSVRAGPREARRPGGRQSPEQRAVSPTCANGASGTRPRSRPTGGAARLRKASRHGRPPDFDEDRHEKCNTVDRAVNELKNSRAVATHYDRRGYVYSPPSPHQPSSSRSTHERARRDSPRRGGGLDDAPTEDGVARPPRASLDSARVTPCARCRAAAAD
nr:transposase [Streptomyces halstedii]